MLKQNIFLQIPYTALVTSNERWIYSDGFTAGFTPEPEQTNVVSVLPATYIPFELIVLTQGMLSPTTCTRLWTNS